MEQNEDLAINLLVKVLKATRSGTPRSTRARAWALLGHRQFERRIPDKKKPTCWNIGWLHLAAECVEEACTLGYECPSMLKIGITVESAGYRRQEDLKHPSKDGTA